MLKNWINKIINFFKEFFFIMSLQKNIIILILGVFGLYFKQYLLTIYAFIHFIICFGQYISKTFDDFLESFKKDQLTIKKHYIEDFKFFYYFSIFVKLSTLLFYIYFLSLGWNDIELIKKLENIYLSITYVFIIVMLIDLGITIYIILYKNNPVYNNTIITICYSCVSKGLPVLLGLHVTSHTLYISPNFVSNTYNIYSPIGRGFGVWSSDQLLHIDHLKTHLGKNFNINEIIDENKMVDQIKLENYEKKCGLDFKYNFDFDLEI